MGVLGELCCCLSSPKVEAEATFESSTGQSGKPVNKWIEKARVVDDRIILEVDTSYPRETIAARRKAIKQELKFEERNSEGCNSDFQ